MKINPNYFFVNRELLHSDRWLKEPFTRGQAWVDLFGLAQHTDGFFRVRGIRVNVKRGQLGYSQITLSKRWRWSRGKVKRYLTELEKYSDIVQQKTNEITIITIVKYDLWQGNRTANSTTNEPQTDRKQYTYKKDKKEKNDKKDESINYLSNIPLEDLKEFTERFKLSEKVIKSKAEDLVLYCKSKGKTYKDYKAFLLNALKKDFTSDKVSSSVNKVWKLTK